MPQDDKTLAQTIRSVMTEPAKASEPVQQQTGQALSTGTTSGETQSGGTPEYVNGVDISTFPEQERAVARRALEEKGKLLETGYQKKFSEIAEFKRQREEILKLGISESEAVEAIRSHVASKTTTKDAKKEVSRIIDKLRDEAHKLEDPREIKAALRGYDDLEGIIKELTSIDDIKKELADLKGYVTHSRGRDFQTREQSLNGTLDALTGEYGKEFIDKYREVVIKEGLKYVDADPEQILGAIANPKELKQAILSNVQKSDRTQEKIKAVSSPGSGITNPAQTVDVRGTSLKGVLSHVFAKK